MLKVAARFGVSSSYMARVCTRAPSGLSNGGKRRIATSQPRILCDWNSRKSPELMGLLTEFVVDYRRKGLSSEYFPFYYAVIRRMDPSIMRNMLGLYLVVKHTNKWGVRCLDCRTVHNRAGPFPVKIPKRFSCGLTPSSSYSGKRVQPVHIHPTGISASHEAGYEVFESGSRCNSRSLRQTRTTLTCLAS